MTEVGLADTPETIAATVSGRTAARNHGRSRPHCSWPVHCAGHHRNEEVRVPIRAKAPLRVSFAGGGTDVPPFPEREGGCVLSATINRYAGGTFRPRADGQICVDSLDFGLSVTYGAEDRLVYDGKLDLVKAAILKMGGRDTRGFDLFLHSDAPPGSGLGASSAMMVALV